MEMKTAINDISNSLGISVTPSCVNGGTYDQCVKLIKENAADLVTLDGGHVYTAGICLVLCIHPIM